MELLKKENLLLVAALICVAIWYYRKQISNPQVQEAVKWLPVAGGLAFGLNTLLQIVK